MPRIFVLNCHQYIIIFLHSSSNFTLSPIPRRLSFSVFVVIAFLFSLGIHSTRCYDAVAFILFFSFLSLAHTIAILVQLSNICIQWWGYPNKEYCSSSHPDANHNTTMYDARIKYFGFCLYPSILFIYSVRSWAILYRIYRTTNSNNNSSYSHISLSFHVRWSTVNFVLFFCYAMKYFYFIVRRMKKKT